MFYNNLNPYSESLFMLHFNAQKLEYVNAFFLRIITQYPFFKMKLTFTVKNLKCMILGYCYHRYILFDGERCL